MIIGQIEIEPEDPSKQKKITEDIGYNPNKKNIIRIPNFNLNTIKEKKNDDLEKLTLHYLELLEPKTEDSQKVIKKTETSTTNNNFYDSILYPEAFPEKNIHKKPIAYDGGTFLTDKINFSDYEFKSTLKEKKETIKKEENLVSTNDNSNINNLNIKIKTAKTRGDFKQGFETVPELKKGIPVNFDKLIVNIKDGQNKPKPINPLFFIINGDKPVDKRKFINFRTNPSLFTATMKKKNSLKNLEEFFIPKNKKTDNNVYTQTPTFATCFNKICENKSKLTYDLKKTIFNDKNTVIEEKYKLLKDLQRNELMNRALGRGIFSCNKYFDEEKRALAIQNRHAFEKYLEESKDKLVINLRTHEDFFDDKKKSYIQSQKYLLRDYLPVAKDDYKKIEENKEFKLVGKFKTPSNDPIVEGLYKPESRQRISNQILVDHRMDKILRKAKFPYEKPYNYLASNINRNKEK